MWLRRADSLHSMRDEGSIVDNQLSDCAQALTDEPASLPARACRPVWHRQQRPRALWTLPGLRTARRSLQIRHSPAEAFSHVQCPAEAFRHVQGFQ